MRHTTCFLTVSCSASVNDVHAYDVTRRISCLWSSSCLHRPTEEWFVPQQPSNRARLALSPPLQSTPSAEVGSLAERFGGSNPSGQGSSLKRFVEKDQVHTCPFGSVRRWQRSDRVEKTTKEEPRPGDPYARGRVLYEVGPASLHRVWSLDVVGGATP